MRAYLVLLLVGAAGTPLLARQSDLSPAEREVWTQEERCWETREVRDLKGSMTLWAEDFRGWPSNEPAPGDWRRSARTRASRCGGPSPAPGRDTSPAHVSTGVPAAPLVLGLDEGERRVRRGQATGLSSPFILKVDGRNGGSPDLVMGYEDIAPGQAIAPHRHQMADEIIFVHRGSGVVELDSRVAAFSSGATIYIPKHVRVAVRNTGTEPLSIAFVFSKPGFEELLRDTSVPEGQPVVPLSAEERSAIRARHRWHTVYE
jgi:quercetin dioxygenase-like cupin family protein